MKRKGDEIVMQYTKHGFRTHALGHLVNYQHACASARRCISILCLAHG